MLEHIDIRNLALIEDIHIDFTAGFNVLTGETGAGKSIILGALGLLMGEKADGNMVRTGAPEASIAALVSLDSNHTMLSWLRDHGVEPDDGAVLIRRVVRQRGRGAIYVQSTPMTRSDLATISDALFDMHGQHEHQSLLHSDRQRKVLDSYGECTPELETYAVQLKQLEALEHEASSIEHALEQAGKEADYLAFVAEELDRAQVQPSEDDLLEEEVSVLSQYETIQENLELVHDTLKGAVGEGAVHELASAMQASRRAAKADASLEEIAARLETIYFETQDIAESLRDRLSQMSFSQARLDELQARLALLQRLKKKYGPSLDAVIRFHNEVKEKLTGSEQSDERLEILRKEIRRQDELVQESAQRLRKKRIAAAERLQKEITARLVHLGMPHVVFSIEVTEKQRTIHGADQVDFWFSANLGEPKRSMKEIASGGELSRVMLAVKTVLAEADDVETLVFDEVDAGIGGSVAIAVGQQMAELAQSRQVIAITHLASIAAKAEHHLVVHKETEQGRTYTKIHPVTEAQRIAEIARMLSGRHDDERALAHARSLVI